jgi:hypothetical protein
MKKYYILESDFSLMLQQHSKKKNQKFAAVRN